MTTSVKKKMSANQKRKPAIARGTKKSASCWEGYKRVPGTKPGARGSCSKKKAA